MTLIEANIGEDYLIKDVLSEDEELNAFLFSLGCYSGEMIRVIAYRNGGYTVAIKDARYNIDRQLAEAIRV